MEHVFWDNQQPIKRINNTLTTSQAVLQLNKLALKYKFDEKDLEDLDVLKEWIKSK